MGDICNGVANGPTPSKPAKKLYKKTSNICAVVYIRIGYESQMHR
jgi:hypothetical protein